MVFESLITCPRCKAARRERCPRCIPIFFTNPLYAVLGSNQKPATAAFSAHRATYRVRQSRKRAVRLTLEAIALDADTRVNLRVSLAKELPVDWANRSPARLNAAEGADLEAPPSVAARLAASKRAMGKPLHRSGPFRAYLPMMTWLPGLSAFFSRSI
jgi:hypothetical protein